MTVKELSQLYQLNREIDREKERIRQLRDAATNSAAKISGLPHASCLSDKTAIAASIADSEAIIEAKVKLCVVEYNRLCRYVAGIDDSLIRQIISFRFIDGMTWRSVAHSVGGGNTEDSVRQAFHRFIKGETDQKDHAG